MDNPLALAAAVLALAGACALGLVVATRDPATFPFAATVLARAAGIVGSVVLPPLLWIWPGLRGRVQARFFRALRETRRHHVEALRDATLALDGLPTVQRGNRALGIERAFDARRRGLRKVASPYTHPLQRPLYYVPGIPSSPFTDVAGLPWVEALEEAFPVVKREFLGLLEEERGRFRSYETGYGLVVPFWNTYNLFIMGRKFEENCERCPETVALLESLPGFEKDHVMFSVLNPHSRIPPHYGPFNAVLRAHLPLVVPPRCGLRVGDEERTWREGEVLAFDDSFRHEAWNDGDGYRAVLFLNFWHPCLANEEIAVLERFRRAFNDLPVYRQYQRIHEEPGQHRIVERRAA